MEALYNILIARFHVRGLAVVPTEGVRETVRWSLDIEVGSRAMVVSERYIATSSTKRSSGQGLCHALAREAEPTGSDFGIKASIVGSQHPNRSLCGR